MKCRKGFSGGLRGGRNTEKVLKNLTEQERSDLEVRKDLSNYANRKSKLAKLNTTMPINRPTFNSESPDKSLGNSIE